MKTKIYFLLMLAAGLSVSIANTYAVAHVELTTNSVPAADVNQGTVNHIVYAVKMKVTDQDVTVNNIKFTFSGTHDNNDLTTTSVYFNATAADLNGASF
ncbi:MAG: hypothetical protein ABIQ74_07605 [Chitinophagales bacterium]